MVWLKKFANSLTLVTWTGQLVSVFGNLILLPLISKTLGEISLGLWLTFLLWNSLAMLLDSGFSVTTGRFVAYTVSGQSKNSRLIKLIFLDECPSLYHILRSSRVIYRVLSLLLIILMLVAMRLVDIPLLAKSAKISSIEFFAAVVCYALITLNTSRLSGFLQGSGHVITVKKIEVLINSLRLLSLMFTLMIFNSFQTLVFVVVLMQLLRLAVYYYYFKIRVIIVKHEYSHTVELFKELLYSSGKVGILGVSGFVISSFTAIYFSSLKGTNEVIEFLLLHKFILTLFGFSMSLLYAKAPDFNRLIAINNFTDLRFMFRRYLVRSILAFMLPSIVLFFCWEFLASEVFSITTGSMHSIVFILLIVGGVLEIHHTYYATLYIGFNKVPFVVPAVISALAIVILMPIGFSNYSIIGVVLVPFVIQLSFNNWYPVFLVRKKLGSIW